MAEQKKPRGPGSRNPSRAPRTIAGHGTRETPRVEWSREPTPTPTPELEPKPEREPKPVQKSGPGILSSSTATKVLSGVLALLLVIGLAELAYLFVFTDEKDETATPDRPVTVPMSQWRTATEQSAKSVTDILDVSWKEYDQNLDDAAKLMTDKFSKEYTATTADSKPRFIKTKAEYDFAVVGQSVVKGTPDEVTTLLFLNQFVYKGEGKQRVGPEIYQVRVEATVVRDGDKWLIDDLQAL